MTIGLGANWHAVGCCVALLCLAGCETKKGAEQNKPQPSSAEGAPETAVELDAADAEAAKEEAAQQAFQALMEAHAARFDLEVLKLPRDGRLPSAPRLLLIECFPKWSPGSGETSGTEKRYWPYRKDGGHGSAIRAAIAKLPPEAFARQPNEVNTIVVIAKGKKQVGQYSDGSAAYRQEWRATVINLEERKLVAERSFTGGSPSGIIEGHVGRRTGDEPRGIGEWIDKVLKEGNGTAP